MSLRPDYERGGVRLFLGDALEILSQLDAGSVDAVVTDPPYGVATNVGTCVSAASVAYAGGEYRKDWEPICGDDHPFDPAPLLALSLPTVLWGANNYASALPDSGGWIVWDKRRGGTLCPNWHGSDAELAWTNLANHVRVFSHMWAGFRRDSEVGKHLHPTQKPIELMAWCCERATEGAVLDPFMGSGTTGVACVRTGRKFVGIEIEPKYFDIAVRRIDAELRQGRFEFAAALPTVADVPADSPLFQEAAE